MIKARPVAGDIAAGESFSRRARFRSFGANILIMLRSLTFIRSKRQIHDHRAMPRSPSPGTISSSAAAASARSSSSFKLSN